MSDTTNCPSCGVEVPSAAAFCTSCGHKLEAAQDPGPDPTRVETPGLNDATQVQPVAEPTPPPPPPSSGAWGPMSDPSEPVTPTVASSAPWNPPASPPPPTYAHPNPPPPGPSFAPPQPMAGGAGDPAWTAPSAAPQPGSWNAPASPQTMAKRSRTSSVLGGLIAIGGAVLVLVGVFSGWVTLESGGGSSKTISAWAMTSGDEFIKSNDPYLLVCVALLSVAIGVVLLAGFARTLARIGAVLAGGAVIAIAALDWKAITDFAQDNLPTSAQVSSAIGFYLAIAGGVLIIVGALIPVKKQ